LVGHDWGATIAFSAAAKHPSRFHTITTLSVPKLSSFITAVPSAPWVITNLWYIFFFQLPIVPEHWLQRDNFSGLDKLWRDWSVRYSEERLKSVKETFSQTNVVPSALAYYRAVIFPGFGWLAATIGSNSTLESIDLQRLQSRPSVIPTLHIHGSSDACIPLEMVETLMPPEDFPIHLQKEVIQDAGHFVHHEQPEKVNQLVIDWIKTHTKKRKTPIL